jgi:NAD(P)-dependent dehydrogenase (short-subunit alcohol dehydrogenase family)
MERIAVVTGASAGVGRATARAFAECGYDVALLARGRAGLEAAAGEVRELGRRALPIQLDVADASAVRDAAARVEAELGPIDVWVNDAMVSVFSPVHAMRADEYRRVTEVTYLGTVHGTLAALEHMRARDAGVIVQVGSALAYRSIPLQSAYCAAKHAVIGFTDSLRTELIHERSRIEVTVVNLPAINTPQFDWVRSRLPGRGQPVPPIFQPEVAARAITHAADHPRRELQVGRSTYLALWGQKVAPGLLDRYLGMTGYQNQQTQAAEDPDRPDNLFSPLDEETDHGAHGRFDGRSATWSPALRVSLHRRLISGVAAGMAGMLLAARATGTLPPSRSRSLAERAGSAASSALGSAGAVAVPMVAAARPALGKAGAVVGPRIMLARGRSLAQRLG